MVVSDVQRTDELKGNLPLWSDMRQAILFERFLRRNEMQQMMFGKLHTTDKAYTVDTLVVLLPINTAFAGFVGLEKAYADNDLFDLGNRFRRLRT